MTALFLHASFPLIRSEARCGNGTRAGGGAQRVRIGKAPIIRHTIRDERKLNCKFPEAESRRKTC